MSSGLRGSGGDDSEERPADCNANRVSGNQKTSHRNADANIRCDYWQETRNGKFCRSNCKGGDAESNQGYWQWCGHIETRLPRSHRAKSLSRLCGRTIDVRAPNGRLPTVTPNCR